MKHRLVLRLVVAVTIALILGSLPTAPAQAKATTGKISGTVHVSGISPLPPNGVFVWIWHASSAPLSIDKARAYELTVSSGTGHYSIAGIKPGKYIALSVVDSDDYAYGFYRSTGLSSKAKRFTVKAGKTASGINIYVHHAATIDATIQNMSGTGLSNIEVTPYDADGVQAGFSSRVTDAAGKVHLYGLPGGSYRLKIASNGIPRQWVDGIDRLSAAKTFKVGSGKHLTGAVVTARANGAYVSTGKPVITGTRKKGHTLKTTDGTWEAPPASFIYRWLRNGKSISGATSNKYKLTSADVGKHISVRVGAVVPDAITGTTISSRTGKIKK